MKTKFQLKCEHCKRTFPSLKKVIHCPECTEKAQQVDIQKLNYSFKQYTLNADTIDYFQFMDNRRKLSMTQVKNLHGLMFNGGHFETPIVVNEIPEHYRVIDGNHRLEAFKRLLKRRKKANIEIMLVIYENLTSDEENDVFRKWNMGRVQSINDFIMNVRTKIPILSMFEGDFPVEVTIYPEPNSLSFRSLANAYIAAKQQDETGRSYKKDKFLQRIKELDEDDYAEMKKFCSLFLEAIGPIEKHGKKKFYCTTFFPAVMYLYFNHKIKKENIEVMSMSGEVVSNMVFRGRAARQNMIKLMRKWK